MRVLVTGGAGYIGSVVVAKLIEQGFSVSVFDDLSSGHKNNNIGIFVKTNIGSDSPWAKEVNPINPKVAA